MARVTVEDCLAHVKNRFDLVLLATKRARQLEAGVQPLVERGRDKSTVVALREIGAGLVNYSTVAPRAAEVDLALAEPEEIGAAEEGGQATGRQGGVGVLPRR